MNELYRCILVSLVPPTYTKEEAEDDLEELKSLVTTFGGATIVKIIQKRDYPDNTTYIGTGKAEELAQIVKDEKAEVVIINAIVKPGQLYNLQKVIATQINKKEIPVWDRVELILQIFSKHANTAEAKLQIELAQMRHMGPRIYGMGMILSRQGGGTGNRGIGETNTELMKRHWRTQIKQVQDKIQKQSTEREKQMARRKELGLQTVSIVGYTNAGKSSLFNTLTKKKKLVENALFATLDSAVGELYLPEKQSTILVSDTIGFIQKLPPQLIDAFKSTLMESINANMLLHVIDITDPKMEEKIETVEQILSELNTTQKKKIYVFNKTDLPHSYNKNELQKKYQQFYPVFISTQTKENCNQLVELISTYL